MRFSDFLLVSDPTDLNFIVGYTDEQNIRINVLDLFTGQIIGSGTAGYVPLFTAANVIDDSVIFQHGSNIVIGGVDSLGYKLAVSGSLYSSNGAVINSTVSGADALRVIGGDGDIFVIPNDLGQPISSLRRIIHPPAILTTESATLGQLNTAISNLEEDIEILLDLKVDKSSVGEPNGVASLDATGKIPLSEIPDSIIGQVEYMGTWNAFTNTPTLNPLVPEQKGHYYVVSAAGVFGGVDYAVGDWIISNGVEWQKVDNTDAVTSVFGRIGAILALEADYQSFYPRLSQAYDNPTWINSLAFTKITGVPPFLLENQTITLSGDVTGSGKTSISSTISNNAVSNEKLRDSVGTSVIGRSANSTGDPADIQASTDGHVLLRSAGNLLFGLISSDSISSINWSKITGTPTTLSGYGITDAYTKTESDNKFVPYTGANANVNLGSNNITANSFIKAGGTSSQFLKADGSVDLNHYVPNTRSVNAGTGLTGGGNLSSDVTISFDTTWGDTRYAYRTRQLTINGITFDLSADRTWNVGTVTSLGLSAPTGFAVSNSPVTSSGTLALSFASGYSLPTNAVQANWTTAYNDSIISAAVTGTATKTLTLNQQDGGTITASWSDIDTAPVTSVFGRIGDVVAQSGDYNTSQVTESGNLYFTNARSRSAVSLTTTGTSGVATYDAGTGVFNIPNYGSALTGYVPYTGANQTVNLNTQQLQAGHATFTTNGSTDTLTINHTSGSGRGIVVTKSGSGEGLTVVKSSGSGNVASITGGITLLTTLNLTNALADTYIASAANWNTAYNNRITSLTTTGTSGVATLISHVLNIPQYQAQGNYITQLSGEATASGPGNATVTLTNSAVTGKVLTGLTVAGSSIASTDSILTAFGKLQGQVNDLIGGLQYQGTWNASTNTPSITSGVGTDGHFYIVSVAGNTTIDGVSGWQVGDWIVFHSPAWQKVDNTESVVSVNGLTGAVTLTTSNITEGTNLYFTNARARTAISLTTTGNSGASNYNNGTGVLNVPQYSLAGLGGVPTTRALTINGINFDLSADRTWSVGTVTNIATSGPITGGPITGTGTIGITQASSTSDGFLSSTDWNTFNNKQATISLTTTGNSGSSTFISNVLNVPTYTLAGLGGVPTTRTITINGIGQDLSDDRSWSVGTVTGVTASSPLFSSGGVTPNITIQQASGSQSGFLSSTDWNTFNGKQPAGNYVTLDTTQTITGQKTFSRGAASFGGTTQSLLIDGDTQNGALTINSNGSAPFAYQTFAQAGVGKFEMGIVGTSSNGSFYINRNIQVGSTGASIYIKKADGFVGVNNTDPSFQFDVVGVSRIYSSDTSGVRTEPHTVLNIVADNTSNPFGGFGAALVFQQMIYSGGGVPGGIRVGARIRTATQTFFGVNNGTNLIFDVTQTGDGTLVTALTLDYGLNATFVGNVTASISALGTPSNAFVVSDSGTLRFRTAAQVLSDIGAQASGNYVTLDTTQTITGKKTFSNAFGDNDPIVALVGTSTSTFQYLTTAYNASLEANKNVCHFFGRSSSIKNSGYIGYQWVAAGSNANFVTIGQYGNDHILKVYGNGLSEFKDLVGIGINPSYKLQVYTDADVWHTVIGGGTGQLRIGGQTSDGAVIQAYTVSGGVANRHIYLQRDGANVIINGTFNTGDRLQVNGTGYISSRLGIGDVSGIYSLQLGTNGSLTNSIRMGNYLVPKNTRQYIGYTRWDTGLFESSGDGDTPSTVMPGVAGIRIVNTEGTVTPAQADNSVQIITHIYNGNSRIALHASYSGFVGINGITNPTYALDVNGTGRFSGLLAVQNSRLGLGIRSSGRGELFLNSSGTDFVSEMFFGFGNGYNENNIRWALSDRGTTTGDLVFFAGPANGGFLNVLSLNKSGAATFSSSVTSTGLIVNGQEFYYAPANYSSGGFSRILGRNESTGRIEGMSAADIQAFIGLGSYVTLTTTQTITGQKTISRNAAAFSGTTQSFLIDGAAGNGALTINSASAYAYQTFAQAGTGKFEIGIVGTLGAQYGSLYINRNIQTGETGASIYVRKSDGFVGVLNITPVYQLDTTGRIRAITASSGVSPRTDLGGTIIAEGSTRAGLYILTSGTAAGSYGSIWWGNGHTNTDGSITVQNDTRSMDFGTADGLRLRISSTGIHNIFAIDPSGNRTIPVNSLIIQTDNNSNPYNGFGGTILFKNRIYSGGPSPGGIRDSARIRTSIENNASVNHGTNLIFENTATGDGPLQAVLTLDFNRNATFEGSITMPGVLTINRNTAGLVFNRTAVTNFSGIYYSTAGSPRWFIGLRENLSSNNYICYSEQTAVDVMTLNLADNSATFGGNLFNNGLLRTRGTSNDVFWAGASQSASFGAVLGDSTSSRTAFFRSSSTTGAASVWWGMLDTSGRNIPVAAIDGTSTGGLTFWHNSAGSGGGSWTNIFLYNLSGVQIFGTLSVSADVIAFASSDRRLKDNLTKIDSSLEKVGKLSGYSFDWNSNQETYSGKDYGVVAQEVEAIFPELVKTRDNGYKAVKYEKLIPVLIEAIKELNEKVEKLK
jgi:hypothetical protein